MIYADYNGTAPLCPEVKGYLLDRLENGPFANPNAIHCLGSKVLQGMEKCRIICAEALGAKKEHIIFTSGASEAISQVFHSVLSGGHNEEKKSIIISAIEHSAVVNAAEYYKKLGHNLKTLPVKENGIVCLDTLNKWMQEDSTTFGLVSIMAANNESGVIQPYEEIAKICEKFKVPYFSDTTQYIGKAPFSFVNSGLDYACMSGHKIGALPGCGILLVKNWKKLSPIVFGGGQERGLRGGTQNYIGNETLAVALNYFNENLPRLEKVERERINFEKKLKEAFPNIVIIGEQAKRLPSTTLISYPGIHGQAVQIELESHDIFVTTSSACSDNEPATSKVLKAMKVEDSVGRGVIRISLGLCDHPEDLYEQLYEILGRVYAKLGEIKSY